MSGDRFVPVAGALGVEIHAPETSSVSFCNSPFPAHRDYGALDIYPLDAKFNDSVACPVNGIVKEVRRFSSPSLSPDKPPIYEYLTLIESDDNPSVYVKIIHACPKVSVDESVKVGDKIAALVRSGYYPFWVDPHIHVELRKPEDPLRATGSYDLDLLGGPAGRKPETKTASDDDVKGVVTKVEKRYVTIEPNPENWVKIGNFSGLSARVGEATGILDGGLPFMGYAGVVTEEKTEAGAKVFLAGKLIGEITKSLNGFAKLKTTPFKFMVKGHKYLGIANILSLGDRREIRVIPLRLGQISLHVGETVTLNKS